MQIIVNRKGSAVILLIQGHFNAGAVPEFERICTQQIESGQRRFVLNMAELSFVSSAGLCSLLTIAKKIKDQDGSLVICGLQGEALKVFEISGFAALFPICHSETMALKEA